MTAIPTLTVNQPWAAYIFHGLPAFGIKWCENRSWTSRHRGTLFIHANKVASHVPPEFAPDATDEATYAACSRLGILGSVDVVAVACQRDMDEAYDHIAKQTHRKLTPEVAELMKFLPQDPDNPAWEWYGGDAVLILRNPRLLREPIRGVHGKLGIWRYEVDESRLAFQDAPAESGRQSKGNRRTRPVPVKRK